MSNLPAGVLLAAGRSRRFGGNKLLHPVADGIPMLLVAANKLVDILPESIVVINQALVTYTDRLEQIGMKVVVNEQADCGIGSSIACGVRASADATGWLIALADMPYINPHTIKQLSQRLQDGAGIVAPSYKQQRGHPVGFNQYYKDDLIALEGDVGARHILKNHQDRLELVESDDAGVITDIDQLSDQKPG